MVVSCSNFLSEINGGQTSKVKELERDYEDVLDYVLQNRLLSHQQWYWNEESIYKGD